jgi:hypothetical protein
VPVSTYYSTTGLEKNKEEIIGNEFYEILYLRTKAVSRRFLNVCYTS